MLLFGPKASESEIVGLLLQRCNDFNVSPKLRAMQVLNTIEIKTIDAERVTTVFIARLNNDHHSPIRFAAALGLARLGYEARPALPNILKQFKEEKISWEIKRACLMALIAIGHSNQGKPAPEAIEGLLLAAEDKNCVEIRLEAAIGLGAIGKTNDAQLTRKIDVVLKKLAKDGDPHIPLWARFSELTLGEPKEEDVLDLAKHFKSDKVEVRWHALRAMGALGLKAKPAQAKVIETLNDKDPLVQTAALHALAAMQDRNPVVLKALKDMIDRKDLPPGIRQTAQLTEDVLLKRKEPTILPMNPTPAAPEAPPTEWEGKSVATWLANLKNPDPSIRERAISALPIFGKDVVGGAQVMSLLIEAANDDKDEVRDATGKLHAEIKDASPRIRAVQMLCAIPLKGEDKLDVRRVKNCLKARLKDGQAILRYEAAAALVRFGPEAHDCIDELYKLSSDTTSWELRRASLGALAVIGRGQKTPDARAVNAMCYRANVYSEPCADVRLQAAMGLGALGRTTSSALKLHVEKALDTLAKDRDPRVVIWAKTAQMALAGHNDKYAMAVVDKIKPKEDIAVRKHALRTVATMGPYGRIAQDRTLDALNDKDPSIQLEAINALMAMQDRGPRDSVVNALKEQAGRKDLPKPVRDAADTAAEFLRRGRVQVKPADQPKKPVGK